MYLHNIIINVLRKEIDHVLLFLLFCFVYFSHNAICICLHYITITLITLTRILNRSQKGFHLEISFFIQIAPVNIVISTSNDVSFVKNYSFIKERHQHNNRIHYSWQIVWLVCTWYEVIKYQQIAFEIHHHTTSNFHFYIKHMTY